MPCSPLVIIRRYKGEMGRGEEGAGSFSALFSFNNYMSYQGEGQSSGAV